MQKGDKHRRVPWLSRENHLLAFLIFVKTIILNIV